MTSPAAASRDTDEVTAPKVAVLDVVGFTHRDPILGGTFPALGVVMKAGDKLTVVPLQGYFLQVDPAAVDHVLTAADLG